MIHRPTRRDTRFSADARPQFVGVVALTCGFAYLAWRVTTLGHSWQFAYSLPLYVAEAWSFAQLALLTYQAWRVPDPGSGPPTGAKGSEQCCPEDSMAPMEVVIDAHDADEDAVLRSLVGTRSLVGHGAVRVVDSRMRQGVKELADQFDAAHIIDAGLGSSAAAVVHEQATTDLYLWLEAGQVPMPSLLGATVERFGDPSLAACQVAVGLMNADSFVHVRHGRDEEALLRDVIGPAMGRRRAAPWFGAASIVRREAIDRVGGFATDDPAAVDRTQVLLQQQGWGTAFEARRLVRAVAPDTLDNYLRQRHRRAIEALRVFRTANSPLAARSLRLRYRLAHVAAASHYTSGLRQLVLIAVLAVTLVTARLPFDAPVGSLALFWGASSATAVAARRALGRGSMGIGDWTRHAWRTVGVDARALHAVVSGRTRESQSSRSAGSGISALGRLSLLSAAVVVLDLALLARAATLVGPDLLPSFSSGARVFVLAVSLLALAPMVDVLQMIVLRRQRRRHFRLHATLEVKLAGVDAETLDLAPTGMGVALDFAPVLGAAVPFRLRLPTSDGVSRWIKGTALVRAATPEPRGLVRVGFEFQHLADDARTALIEYCMIGDARRVPEQASDAPIAHVHHLEVGHRDRHRRQLQVLTAGAAVAALVTLLVGPAATGVSAEEATQVDEVCVLTAGEEPVRGAIVEQRSDGTWTRVGATEADGCVSVRATGSTAFAATHEGLRLEQSARALGSDNATFVLVRHDVHVVDSSGEGVPGAGVRYFTDRWLDGAVTDASGSSWFEVLRAPTPVEVTWQGARLVLPADAATFTVVLGRIDAGDGIPPVEISRGGGWEPFVDAMEVLPGRATIRLEDGSVVKVMLRAGHVFTVATQRFTDLGVTPASPEPSDVGSDADADDPAEADAPTPEAGE